MSAQGALALSDVLRDATISRCGLYRYDLSRTWRLGAGRVAFIGLNPSTADAYLDDPTIRRCMGFANSWGYGSPRMVNLYAYRATDPRELGEAADAGVDPVGLRDHNDTVLREVGQTCSLVVAAWGAHPMALHRAAKVIPLLPALSVLGLTKAGQPRHPLYMRADTRPTPWTPEEVADAA